LREKNTGDEVTGDEHLSYLCFLFGALSDYNSRKYSPEREQLCGENRREFRVSDREGICGAGYWRKSYTKDEFQKQDQGSLTPLAKT
jgi:hypothetical protein